MCRTLLRRTRIGPSADSASQIEIENSILARGQSVEYAGLKHSRIAPGTGEEPKSGGGRENTHRFFSNVISRSRITRKLPRHPVEMNAQIRHSYRLVGIKRRIKMRTRKLQGLRTMGDHRYKPTSCHKHPIPLSTKYREEYQKGTTSSALLGFIPVANRIVSVVSVR